MCDFHMQRKMAGGFLANFKMEFEIAKESTEDQTVGILTHTQHWGGKMSWKLTPVASGQ